MPGPRPCLDGALAIHGRAGHVRPTTVLKSTARQFVQILLVAGQHVLDEILCLGAVHGVQGGHLLGVGGLKLAVAAAVLLNALDDGGKRSAAFKILRSASFSTLPVSQTWVSACNSSGCRLAITRALSCSTALYAVRRASFLYLTGVGMSPVRISGAS